jgi:hypothetical protein
MLSLVTLQDLIKSLDGMSLYTSVSPHIQKVQYLQQSICLGKGFNI